MLELDTEIEPIKVDLDTLQYTPLIPGSADELEARILSFTERFPLATELFSGIIHARKSRHPRLEDWLILPHYQFFWDGDLCALQWFEDLYLEAINFLGPENWKIWQEETLKQSDCISTHALCDRLYDYQLQLYSGLFWARKGASVQFIPTKDGEKSPDVLATSSGRSYALESKFVHTHEKFESFWHRFNSAAFKYATPRPPILFCEQFRLPASERIPTLSPESCLLIKALFSKACESSETPIEGTSKLGAFNYNVSLPSAPVTLDAQREFAHGQGMNFADAYLTRVLDGALSQMADTQYGNVEKMLFIGIQPGRLYLAPWTESVLAKVKDKLKSHGLQKNVNVVFSEDVGFSVRGYV